jgi:hypothetical protein
MESVAPEGVTTDSEASAKDVAKIIRQIMAEKVPAVFLENVTDHRLLDQIARETGAKVGGTLYSDALSDSKGPAATYLEMFRSRPRFRPRRRSTPLVPALSRSGRLSLERSRLHKRVYARLRRPNGGTNSVSFGMRPDARVAGTIVRPYRRLQ